MKLRLDMREADDCFDKLWETMKAKHVSTYALRDRFDIDSRTIRRLRANQTVTTDTLDKLCRILDCKLYEIAEYLPEEAEMEDSIL